MILILIHKYLEGNTKTKIVYITKTNLKIFNNKISSNYRSHFISSMTSEKYILGTNMDPYFK